MPYRVPPMYHYECPKCGERQDVISAHAEIGHRCSSNRNRFTEFKLIGKVES